MPVLLKYSVTYGDDLLVHLFYFGRWLNVKLESRITPRCFRDVVWLTVLLLIVIGGSFIFLVFLLKITSRACLLRSGLRIIFHWCAQLLIFTKSSFNSFFTVQLSRITDDVSSVVYSRAIWRTFQAKFEK